LNHLLGLFNFCASLQRMRY